MSVSASAKEESKAQQRQRVCVIGAGPCGSSLLCQFSKEEKNGTAIPEIVCYEKQATWGGLWNFTWRTGTDEYGEIVHNSQYRHLWNNAPKECCELPDYPYVEHFGRATPSYLPGPVMRDYLQGRWKQSSIDRFIKFAHIVKSVTYDSTSRTYSVVAKDLVADTVLPPEIFTQVVVATGIFSIPNVPQYEGFQSFPGRIMHSHDLRDAREFRDKRILLVGSSYSVEDIAIQAKKFGAQSVLYCWKEKPLEYSWPAGFTDRPQLTHVEQNIAHFRDGTSAEVDIIVLCTGYKRNAPFLTENLRLKERNRPYPENLYKGIVWISDGGNGLFYLGQQNQYYSFTMFDLQARWTKEVLLNRIVLPEESEMRNECKVWLAKEAEVKGKMDFVNFQTEYVVDLAKEVHSTDDYDVSDYFQSWINQKTQDLVTYRDHQYRSKVTGTIYTNIMKPYMENTAQTVEELLAVDEKNSKEGK